MLSYESFRQHGAGAVRQITVIVLHASCIFFVWSAFSHPEKCCIDLAIENDVFVDRQVMLLRKEVKVEDLGEDASQRLQSAHFRRNENISYWIERCARMLSWTGNSSDRGLPAFKRLTKIRSLALDNSHEASPSLESFPPSRNRQLRKAKSCENMRKWIVVEYPETGRHEYFAEIGKMFKARLRRSMQSLRDWCYVVVGARQRTTMRRLVFLTESGLHNLPFRIAKLSSRADQPGRKNLGYLYAMSQGADVILDVDWKNLPIKPDANGSLPSVERSFSAFHRPLLYKEEELRTPAELPVWNPYPYFNMSFSWPRGYPWEYLSTSEYKWNPDATESQSCVPVIQQYILTNNPDFDAVHKTMYKGTTRGPGNHLSRSMVAPRNVIAPYNSHSTAHFKDAFWSLMLPTTVAERVKDIWRSYITQSLLHLQPDACLMFSSAEGESEFQYDNLTSDFLQEVPLYSQAAPLIQLIRNLPVKVHSFEAAFLAAYEKLYEAGVVEADDVTHAQAWMADLNQLSIPIPRLPRRGTWMKTTQLCVMYNDAAFAANTSRELAAKYSTLFGKVVFIFDSATFSNTSLAPNKEDPLNSALVDFNLDWPAEIGTHLCNSSKGFWQNRCLHICLKEALEGGGVRRDVLYMADDDYFNFTRAELSLPKDKIWFSEVASFPGHPLNATTYISYGPSKWLYTADLLRIHRVLNSLPRSLTDAYLAHAMAAGRSEGNGLADSIYVPKKYQIQLVHVLEEIEKLEPTMFSEAGMPLAINLVAPGQRYTYEPDFQVWRDWRYNTSMLHHWMQRGTHVHAVKLSVPGPRSRWRDMMAEQLARLVRAAGTEDD